jgi:hypothetical protein
MFYSTINILLFKTTLFTGLNGQRTEEMKRQQQHLLDQVKIVKRLFGQILALYLWLDSNVDPSL